MPRPPNPKPGVGGRGIVRLMALDLTCEHLLLEHGEGEDRGVLTVTINRPPVNALSRAVQEELRRVAVAVNQDDDIRVVVIAGGPKAFAAGADIKQMTGKSAIDMLKIDQFSTWDQIKKTKKPLIAAVSGFALGGGCELTMHCDLIVASETAKLGQPE